MVADRVAVDTALKQFIRLAIPSGGTNLVRWPNASSAV